MNHAKTIDELTSRIEEARAQGAVVLLKWDGERREGQCTVVITRRDTGYAWRKDSSNIVATLVDALSEYEERHAS